MACLRCKFIHRVYSHIDKKSSFCFRTWSIIAQRKRERNNESEQLVTEILENENNSLDFLGVSSTVAELERLKNWKSLSVEQLEKRYNYLNQKKSESTEQVVQTPFGNIRYDNVNAPFHSDWKKALAYENLPKATKERKKGIRRRRTSEIKETVGNLNLSPEAEILLNKLSNLDRLTQEEYFGLIFKLKKFGLDDRVDHEMMLNLHTQKALDSKNEVENSVPNCVTPSETVVNTTMKNSEQQLGAYEGLGSYKEMTHCAPEFQELKSEHLNDNVKVIPCTDYINDQNAIILEPSDMEMDLIENTKFSTKSESCQDVEQQLTGKEKSLNFIDEQYFAEISTSSSMQSPGNKETETWKEDKNETNFIEEQYFGQNESDMGSLVHQQSNVQNEDALSLSKSYIQHVEEGIQLSTRNRGLEIIQKSELYVPVSSAGNSESIDQTIKDSYSTNFIEDQYFNPVNNSQLTSLENEKLVSFSPKYSENLHAIQQNMGAAVEMEQITENVTTNSSSPLIHENNYQGMPSTDAESEVKDRNICSPILNVEKGRKFTDTIKSFEEEASIFGEMMKEYSEEMEGFDDWKTINTEIKTESKASTHIYDFKSSEKTQVKEKKEKQMDNRLQFKKVVREGKSGPQTAYEYVRQAEAEKENPRLIGVKKFASLKPDIENMSKEEMVDLLANNIIYNSGEIVAINKPYGLPSKPGPKVRASVAHLLQALAEKVDGNFDNLYLVHRLDKETTGVMLLTKSMRMHRKLQGAFLRQEIIKNYLAITKGIPSPTEGIIEIPIGEMAVGKKVRMGLLPKFLPDGKPLRRSVDGKDALTRFSVLHQNNNAALVECQPKTGVKHQIRVHLAYGLNTPILGDHKYSYMDKLAPQKLQGNFLEKLKMPQSKVRYLPMHLHASSLLIPHFLDGQNLFVSCPLPKHMLYTLKRLKIMSKK